MEKNRTRAKSQEFNSSIYRSHNAVITENYDRNATQHSNGDLMNYELGKKYKNNFSVSEFAICIVTRLAAADIVIFRIFLARVQIKMLLFTFSRHYLLESSSPVLVSSSERRQYFLFLHIVEIREWLATGGEGKLAKHFNIRVVIFFHSFYIFKVDADGGCYVVIEGETLSHRL